MAWQERGERRYYYRSERRGSKVRKIYCGTGEVGEFAAQVDALHRAERKADAQAARIVGEEVEQAIGANRELTAVCELMTVASLLGAGYHRPSRHTWRIWRNGREALRETI